jgi:hypothetical protein
MMTLVTVACSPSGPEPPRPGTPQFLWGVAQEAHKAGDYLKTNSTLEQLLSKKSDYTRRCCREARSRRVGAAIWKSPIHTKGLARE